MPVFQRLKHPFRRPTHYYTIHEPSPTPKQLERQREKERQRALDKIENDLDDGRIGPRGSDSPDELPVIIDRGSYRGHIYPREQLFFNSIMLASDIEPMYAGPPGGELRQEVHRAPIRRPKMQGQQKPPPRPVPSEYLTASQNAANLRRWEERYNTGAVGRTQQPRPVPSECLTAKQNAENLRRWEERNRGTPTVPRAPVPVHIPSPARPPSPPRRPITPGTREWDSFMDFPLDNSVYVDPGGEVTADTSNSAHILPPTAMPAAPPHPTAASEATFDSALQTNMSLSTQANSSQIQAQPHAFSTLSDRSSIGTERPEPLTWDSALNSVLRNEAIDPAVRTRIGERVQGSSTIAGLGHVDAHTITMAGVSLIPNFSYPIAGSEFHDRLRPEQAPQLQFLEDTRDNTEQEQEQSLSNGVSSGHDSRLSSVGILNYSPTPTNLPLRGGNAESPTQLTNGVPSGYYPASSSSSGDSSNDPRHHPPSPPDRMPEHVFALLCSLLTPSELALHYDVIHDSAPPYPPPFPDQVPLSNATSATPLDVRLVQKLHTAVYGLQDRVLGVEEDLIPELSTDLENKYLRVRELDVENLSLQEEVAELKRIVDFSNKVLTGCWEREWEVWRTLNDIQKRREAYRGLLARIFSRASNAAIQDNELLHSHMPEGYVARPQPFGRAVQGPLKKKELDALLLMAKQNVSILIEDLGEMKGLVEAFQRRSEVEEEVPPAEGSWRDV